MSHRHFLLSKFVIACALLGVSCKGDTGEAQTGQVYYFPEKNTYYDTRTANFYYSLDSAKTWDSLKYAGNDYGSALGTSIALDNQPDLPFTVNDSHRKAYNGIILNLVNSRTRLLAGIDSVKRVKAARLIKPKEIEVEEQVTEEKPKKGIKKFFDKIFGKNKDKKAE